MAYYCVFGISLILRISDVIIDIESGDFIKRIKELLTYYRHDSDLSSLVLFTLLKLFNVLHIIFFSMIIQNFFMFFVQTNFLLGFSRLISSIIYMHYMYMVLKDTKSIKSTLGFYNKVIVAFASIVFLNPNVKESFFEQVNSSYFLEFIGFNEYTVTVWLPISIILVNIIYLFREEYGSRPFTPKEINEINESYTEQFLKLKKLKENNSKNRNINN